MIPTKEFEFFTRFFLIEYIKQKNKKEKIEETAPKVQPTQTDFTFQLVKEKLRVR